MLTLAFDTATDVCTVAVGAEDGVCGEATVAAPKAHMEKLLPLIDRVLGQSGFSIHDVDGLVVGLGPGSFTGVRIGVSIARGLAQGLNKPVVGVSTLDCIAYNFISSKKPVCVALDAKRGEVYAALYEFPRGCLKRLTDHRAMAPEVLCSLLRGHPGFTLKVHPEGVILTGDAIVGYGELFKNRLKNAHFAPSRLWFPKASNLLILGALKFSAEKGDYNELVPIYARLSEAEEKLLRRGEKLQ